LTKLPFYGIIHLESEENKMETWKAKIETAVQLLRSIDDDLGNAICLMTPKADDGEPMTVLSYWDMANMLLDQLERWECEENE
jgi:hypothetical protein